ncbi:curli assembly protein CsgF [Flavobacterium sp. CBA20B-1]|uniref:Curli production assembly/transport component CsgF n=1 Tax=Paenimyroides aestuarii TaxID=2968490 RepID=A0ABY5NNW3_9FLAO|nr:MULTISPECIES: curli assembly protein CsgF [Flavobacteriaceae]UUV20194.1 curli assembly protein CsgF [Paenimyroides aestuarii]WCM43347.1 curli assembly protein CsgF [Flavobacterium sp. CBA20B-1]
MKKLVPTILLLIVCAVSNAQQLVYTPVNPNFGGNPLNYNGLLASANAQNQFDDNKNSNKTSLLDSFSETVKRQILSQLSRGLFEENEDLGSLEEGTFEIGDLIISIDETRTGTVIRIIDNQTGEVTEIIL